MSAYTKFTNYLWYFLVCMALMHLHNIYNTSSTPDQYCMRSRLTNMTYSVAAGNFVNMTHNYRAGELFECGGYPAQVSVYKKPLNNSAYTFRTTTYLIALVIECMLILLKFLDERNYDICNIIGYAATLLIMCCYISMILVSYTEIHIYGKFVEHYIDTYGLTCYTTNLRTGEMEFVFNDCNNRAYSTIDVIHTMYIVLMNIMAIRIIYRIGQDVHDLCERKRSIRLVAEKQD